MTSTEMVRSTGSAIERLPQDSNTAQWTPPQKALMQQLGLINRSNWKGAQPDAPAGVIEAFLMQCQRTRLDPAARQIYAAEMGGKWTVLISIDGFRLIADRTGLYLGKQPTLWCGHDGNWVDVWLSDEPPAAAKVAVMRDGFTEPLVAVATYAGYCPRDNKSGELKPSGQWKSNSSNQLAKCAEMLALRQAFPNELSGLYGTEEMDQAKASHAPAKRAERPAQITSRAGADDAAEWAGSQPAESEAIATPEVTRDWKLEVATVQNMQELTDLATEAQEAGEIGLPFGDGIVMDLFLARRKELESQPEPLVDVPPTKSGKRQWVREARLLTTREGVRDLIKQAVAAGALAQTVEELEAIENTLPDPDAGLPVDSTTWPVAEIPKTEWAEDAETGEFVEQPMALDGEAGS